MSAAGQDITARLPHGPSFRFVDAVVERVAGERVRAHHTWPEGSPILSPAWPWVPCSLLIEALAQVSGLVLVPDGPSEASTGGVLASLGGLTFDQPAKLGHRVDLESRLRYSLGTAARFEICARQGGLEVARGQLTIGGLASEPPT